MLIKRAPVAMGIVLLLASTPARADDTVIPAPAPDFNFNLLPPPPAPNFSPSFDQRVLLRRRTLITHEVLGYFSGALDIANLATGWIDYVDTYSHERPNHRLHEAHLGLAISFGVSLTTTGALALFAPTPYGAKPVRADKALWHKVSMGAAFTAMVASLVLLGVAESRAGHADQKDYELAHLVTGSSVYLFMVSGWLAHVL